MDATTDIVLDANGGDIFFKDNGTTFATITNNGGNLKLKNSNYNMRRNILNLLSVAFKISRKNFMKHSPLKHKERQRNSTKKRWTH